MKPKDRVFTEDEIVRSVIRSMHSGLRIKIILEMKSNLTLAKLMRYLERNYEKKSSTGLCAELTSITQMPNEGLVDFILRCIELREKLILISKTSGEIEYDKVFVSRLLLRSVKRGSESNLILQEKWPLLRAQEETDEDILSPTQRTAADKRDRERNFFKKPSKVKKIVGNPAGSEFDCSDPKKSVAQNPVT